MKLPRQTGGERPGRGNTTAPNRGVAIIVVLVVLAILAALLIANARTLAHLKAEILLVEKRQQQKYLVQPSPPAPVVAPAAEPTGPPAREPSPR
jgi:hypothetical protein